MKFDEVLLYSRECPGLKA